MTGSLNLAAALLLGFAASGHCLVMCGGITAALGMATAPAPGGKPRPTLLLAYQLGRITSYGLAGLLFSGMLGMALQSFDIDTARRTLRVLTGLTLLVAALVVLGLLRDPAAWLGRTLWPRIAPLGRRLLPVRSAVQALAFGALWGWMPCGFVYTVLLIAAMQPGAWSGAALMLAFGLGTLPAMLIVSFGSAQWLHRVHRDALQRLSGLLLLASAMLTVASPWIELHAPGLHRWLPFMCSTS